MITRRFFCQSALSLTALALAGCLPSTERKSHLNIQYLQENQKFPVQITHALGTTHIPQEPKKVVILGVVTPDIVWELGVVPVAMEANFWGGDSSGFVEWYRQAVESSGQKLPELINMYPEPDIEKLMDLQTDLILAPQSGMTAPLFKQLSAIAPVIAYPERAWLTTVDELIEICAASLGRQEQAIQLKEKMAQQQRDIHQQYPQFQQHTFAYIYAAAKQSLLSIYREGDTRVDALSYLGLQLAPFVRNLPLKMGAFTTNIGLENADQLNDVDIVITWFNTELDRDLMAKNPLFAHISAIQRGSYIPLTDHKLASAMYYGTPLAMAWGLPKFLPLLLEAMERVPSKK